MDNAFVHPNAKIGANVKIEPFSYIAENVEIGDENTSENTTTNNDSNPENTNNVEE